MTIVAFGTPTTYQNWIVIIVRRSLALWQWRLPCL